MIRTFFFIGMLGLLSTEAFARSVAVAPAEYLDLATGEIVSEAAKQVEERVVLGAKEAGYDVVAGDEVAAAIVEESGEGECDDSCLQRVAAKLNVDDVIVVKVEDNDQVTYQVTVSFAAREDVTDERTAGFYVVLEWLKGTVALAMKQENIAEESKKPAVAEPADGPPGDTDSTTISARDPGPKKKLSTTPFFIAASATAVFGITTLVINGAAHRSYTTLEDEVSMDIVTDTSDFNDRADKTEKLQLATKVFFITTLTTAVVTGVFALFTDFSGEKAVEPKTALTPGVVVGKQFGAVSLSGTF